MRRLEDVVNVLMPRLWEPARRSMSRLIWSSIRGPVPTSSSSTGRVEHDGRPVGRFHLDKHDPDRGVVDAVLHLVFETPAGPALALAGLVFLVAKVGRV